MTGRFIVLEGPDGSGTTLHAGLLAKHLLSQGVDVLLTCEPTDGPIGQCIREQLKRESLPPEALQLLFTADRCDHIHTLVQPALDDGKTVISDRYALSTLTYGEALGIDIDGLEYCNKKFIQPDSQIILLPPFTVCQERLGQRAQKDILENNALQKKVYDAYVKRARSDNIPVIDSSKQIDDTAAEILELLS